MFFFLKFSKKLLLKLVEVELAMSIRTKVLSNLFDSVPIPQAFDAKLQNLFREVVQMNLSVIHSVRAAEPFRDSLPVPFERDEGVVQLGIASVVAS